MSPWPLPNVWIGTSIENDDYTWRADFLRRIPAATRFLSLEPLLGPLPSLDLDGIHWVIAGGESGPEHRTLDLAWARDIRDRCASKDVAFFFKQVGGADGEAGGRQLDGRTWDQMPALAAIAGALLGGWLGFTATSGLFALVTTTIGAAAGGNLALIAVSLVRERSARGHGNDPAATYALAPAPGSPAAHAAHHGDAHHGSAEGP